MFFKYFNYFYNIFIFVAIYFLIDFAWFWYLKHVREDDFIQDINYSLHWWKDYFKNKY